jgi:hypothetical protein
MPQEVITPVWFISLIPARLKREKEIVDRISC